MPGAREIGADSEQVFGGEPQRVGSFRFFLDGQRWEWSDAVAQMHGYRPGDVTPTTELLLSHKHPEDHRRVARVLERMISDAEPFSSKHRIIRHRRQSSPRRGRRRPLARRHRRRDRDHRLLHDITQSYRSDVKESVDAAVAELAESRAVIEQATGALMLVYGIPADRAFDVLTWCSQQTNTRLRTIAEQLVTGFVECEPAADLRTRFDHLLLTAHQRTRQQG